MGVPASISYSDNAKLVVMVGDSMFNGIMEIKRNIKLNLRPYQLVRAISLGMSK